MITIYGIPNCDTVKKARKWLSDNGVEHQFHDFRKDGLDADLATEMHDAIGMEKLLNKRGTTWRKLDPAAQAEVEGNPVALTEYPALIKRPVFRLADGWAIGFGKAEIASLEEILL